MKEICFVFPGQGSQHIGMGKDMYEKYDEAKQVFERASEILGYNVPSLCFNGPVEELNRTIRTQPCILTVSIAILRVLIAKGLKPSVTAGHSLGEYSALVAAGVIDLDDALLITEKRGQFMQEAVPEGKGLMAAILGLNRGDVDNICLSAKSGYVVPANYNCPGQIVIAGEKKAVEEAIILAKEAGAKRAVPLSVSVPSHCALMADASNRLAELLEKIHLHTPTIPIVNNADALFLNNVESIKSALLRQLSSPLLWEDSIRTIMDSGIDTFVEVGPGKVLSGIIKRVDPKASVFNVEDNQSLERTMAELFKK